ncbi:MAG TPA: carbonic anhydrase family protein [Actinomycetaceae bacterium]|nr:carbonic anhydrase family protein [Actinomycetaceae bacterium]
MFDHRRNKSTFLLSSAAVLAVVLAGCGSSPGTEAPPSGEVTSGAATADAAATTEDGTPTEEATMDEAGVHWGYEGDTGPDHWGELSPDFALCSAGTEQAPIDLTGADQQDLADVLFDYRSAPLQVLNNGHTIQVPSDGTSSITVDGTMFELAQFHFHTPSEHTVDGEYFAGELHLVHQDASGSLAVVAVLLEEGAENEAVAPIISHLPAATEQEVEADGVTLDPLDLLPGNRLTFQYTGSLTTPPCSEDVNWFVLTTPVEMSEAQLGELEQVMGHNNRPLQPLNDRDLLEDTVTG